MYIGQTKKTKVNGMPAEVHYNGRLYLIRIPKITRQYIGDGKTITAAKQSALSTLRYDIKKSIKRK